MNQLLTDVLIASAKELGHPTEGEFALALWIALSGQFGPNPREAAAIYRQCGYQPFQGYPLVRADEKIAA